MPSIVTQLVMFLSSYAPLFAILALRDTFGSMTAYWILMAIAVVSAALLFAYLRLVRTFAVDVIHPTRIAPKDGDSMSYIVTYLIPFLDLDFKGSDGGLALFILFGTLAVLYVNSHMLFTNPMLNLAGYHTYELEDASGRVSVLLTRRTFVRPKADLQVVSVGAYMLLER